MEEMRQSNTYEDKLPLVYMKASGTSNSKGDGSAGGTRQMQNVLRSNPRTDTMNYRSSSKYATGSRQSRKNSQDPTTTTCTQ